MPETETLTLPVLPLTTGVVLPQMVVTLALESPEARDAAEGALATDGRVLLVPRVGTGVRPVGTIARIENEGDLPGGVGPWSSAACAGPRRHPVPAEHPGVWVEAEPVSETPAESGRARRAGARVPRDRARDRRAARLAPLRRRCSPASTTSAPSPTPPGGRPTCRSSARSSCSRRSTPRRASRRRSRWARDALAELEVSDQIRQRVSDGMDKTQREFLLRQQLAAIRKELGESGDDEDVIEEYRAPPRGRRASRERARGGHARGRPARAHQ